MNVISSTQNKYVKRLRELARCKSGQPFFLAEGLKLINEITEDWRIDSFAVSESFAANSLSKINSMVCVNVLSDSIFNSISDTVSPQGILAICEKKSAHGEINFSKPDGLYLVCDRISDPGNMGTIIRNAHAFGCDGLLISENSVDIYNPKIIRASAGSLFRIAFSSGINLRKYIMDFKSHGVNIITTHPRGNKSLGEVDLTKKSALIIGNEASGVSDFLTEHSDELITIPMPGNSESLNAAVACGITLYETVRQRINKNKGEESK